MRTLRIFLSALLMLGLLATGCGTKEELPPEPVPTENTDPEPGTPETPEKPEEPEEPEIPEEPETPENPEEPETPETPGSPEEPEEPETPETPETPENPENPEEPEKPSFNTLGTGLRTLYINTPDGHGIYSKDDWTENCTMILVNDEGTVFYESNQVSMKGRGNSTWTYPKKPYALKLPSKEDLIGTGADKRWVLLANWMDRTLLRNDVSFEIARRTSLEWTPSGEFVELFLNGVHQGNYWLGEKIKTGKARLKADYLIEMDTYYDAAWRFYSQYGLRVNEKKNGMPIGVKEPDEDEMDENRLNELKALVHTAESALYLGTEDWKERMDMGTFIDWFLVHELTYNGEPNHPKSCYFYFRDGKMFAGPVWDFDWFTFQTRTSGFFIAHSIYYEKMFQDPSFVQALKIRWEELKPLLSGIPDYIDAKAGEISISEALNWKMWPCTSSRVNGDEWLTFSQAVSLMKGAYSARVQVLDTAISKL